MGEGKRIMMMGGRSMGHAMAQALTKVLTENQYEVEDRSEVLEVGRRELDLYDRPFRRIGPKGGNRNDPCPCNSGRKYKKCCWAA